MTFAFYSLVFLIIAYPSAIPQSREFATTGEAVCLPHRDSSGPATMECAIGLRDDQGQFYALRDSDPAFRTIAGIRTGIRIEVRGLFTERTDPKYQSVGVIEVASVSVPTPKGPPELTENLPIPNSEGEWTLRVHTSGGLTGRGHGTVTITSRGKRTCGAAGPACANPLTSAKLEPVANMIDLAIPDTWTTPGRSSGLCGDCYTYFVLLYRRDRAKILRTYVASWDQLTQKSAPAELLRIAEAVLALGK